MVNPVDALITELQRLLDAKSSKEPTDNAEILRLRAEKEQLETETAAQRDQIDDLRRELDQLDF